MATFVYNDIIKFILPSGFLFSRDEDDNGKEIVHIMTGEYENDEGETCYEIDCNVNCFEFDPEKEDEEITSENLLNVLTDRLNVSGRMKFPGKPTTVLVNKKIPISVYGNLIKMFALIGIVQISDWLVLQITTSGRFDDDDPSKNTAKVEFLYEVLKAVRINGKKLPIGSTAPHEIENTLHLTFDEDEEIINASPKVQLSISVDDETTTYEYTSEGMMEVGKEYLTSVMPDESLYPHYNSLRYADGPDLNGTSVVVNAGGTEYSFVSFRNAAEDSDTEEPMKALFNRIVAKDTERYDLDRKAKKMQKLFHVNESAFDPRHDRECELEEGFLHRAYMLSGLRSFAWTLADYCKQYGCTPDDIDPDVIFRIANFVANRSWLNYDDTTYCQGLCSGSDLHVYYIPDGVSQADRKKLLPSKEDIDRVKRMKQLFPMYNEILPEVHSLNALRKDLAYIYPAIKVMWDHLEEDRDYNEALLGNVADIVYAWCALALAAKEPFYSEDGPMSCYFSQPVDKEKQEAKWEADKFEKAEEAAEEWMREYEKCLETDPVIDFNGTIFVFSGLVGPWAEKEHPTVRKVIEKGGQYRTKVSGVTNYLVVNPGYAGRSKVDAALEQLQKGKNVKVILLEDLEKALEGKTTTKKAASATAKTAKAATAKTSVKSAPTTKSKAKSSPASSAAKAAVTVVSESDCVIDEFGTLTAYNGTAKEIILPDGIKTIGKSVFFARKKMTSVVIPEGIEIIEDSAFADCRSLKSVTLPDSIQKIGENAFSFCEQLESITIPDGCTEIEDSAFSYCSSLKSVTLPSTIRKISKNAFAACEQLESITIPDECTEIGDSAFSQCGSLKSVTLPGTIQKIGENAFNFCEQLESITIPDGCKEIGNSTFSRCSSLKSVALPGTIQKIGANAFYDCKHLTSIIIPDGCKEIEDYAFSYCSSLKSVTLPGTIQKISDQTFYSCEQLESITIPDECTEIGNGAFSLCGSLKSVILPDSIQKIGEHAFLSCKQLESITIPDECTEIGASAFSNCSSLKSVTLPSAFQKMDEYVFQCCGQLTSITIPNGCTEIGDGAFYLCGSLKSVTLPSTIQQIGKEAFQFCRQLTSITIPDGCVEIGANCFTCCQNLKDIYVTGSVNVFGDDSFSTYCDATVIHTTKGSEAERIAKQNNWKVDYISAPTTKSKAKSSSDSSAAKVAVTEGSENDHVIDDFGTLTSYNGSISATHKASYQPAKKEGCYIATAVYGSYDAPQVMTLRRYRDEILRATAFGRWFIRAYYRLSPPVAEKLKNAKHINKFVRSILNKWVEKLNRRFCV